jgi:hypothetical protein
MEIQLTRAWLRIYFKRTNRWSPFLQVDIKKLPSGEAEADIRRNRETKPIGRVLKDHLGNSRTYYRTPYYPHDNVFVIGPLTTILEQLKLKMNETFPGIPLEDIHVQYHRGNNVPSQE